MKIVFEEKGAEAKNGRDGRVLLFLDVKSFAAFNKKALPRWDSGKTRRLKVKC